MSKKSLKLILKLFPLFSTHFLSNSILRNFEEKKLTLKTKFIIVIKTVYKLFTLC